jgi:hypothetical protein
MTTYRETYSLPIYGDGTNANEVRADRAEAILSGFSDRNGEDDPGSVYLDVADVVTDLAHFCARAGLDFDSIMSKVRSDQVGDLEDGPEAARDTVRWPTTHTCRDCGEAIRQCPNGWWAHEGMPGDCWKLSMDGPGE